VADEGWLSDSEGRIENIALAPNGKNALFPLFEAIMNSIQAIEERFGRDNLASGQIEITMRKDDAGEYAGFSVADNGIGFTKENLISLRKFDSRKKAKIGGKGVGRLLWLKVAEKAAIQSQFFEDGAWQSISFDFTIANPITSFDQRLAVGERYLTEVTINPFRSEFATRIPRRLDTIANRVIAHFVSYFTNISHPQITITDETDTIDLFDAFTEKVERDGDYTFQIEGVAEPFTMHCFLLPKSISDDERSVNALYLGANGRAVTRHELDSVLGMKAINNQFAFFGYVESAYLNAAANETRTSFSLEDEELRQIVDVAKGLAKEFLAPEIKEIRDKQADRITKLGREHPRFYHEARNAEDVAQTLHLATQSEEEIFVELSRQSLRTYNRRRKKYNDSFAKGLPDIKESTDAFMSTLQKDAMSSLAEYVARRKAIIEIFEAGLKFTDAENLTSHYEKVVHGIICPLRSSNEELSYEDHNLWLLDDRLAFYSYFRSDKPFTAQVSGDATSERPDITFFDLGLGFDSSDQNQPITIVEFKRPKRDDYTLADNPISQVRNYVDQLREAGEAIKFDGTPLRTIGSDTPIMCHIIADITPSLRDVMRQLGRFSQKAGSSSYYWWDDNFRTFIEVSSFKEIVSSAKARNQAFFAKLGID
jgi:hypothetical protein